MTQAEREELTRLENDVDNKERTFMAIAQGWDGTPDPVELQRLGREFRDAKKALMDFIEAKLRELPERTILSTGLSKLCGAYGTVSVTALLVQENDGPLFAGPSLMVTLRSDNPHIASYVASSGRILELGRDAAQELADILMAAVNTYDTRRG